MLTFSYRNSIRLMKYIPICPWPKATGLSNIPRNEPTIYVYNHRTVRAEPFFLALAAPSHPPIRFVVDVKLVRPTIVAETLKDVHNSLFSSKLREKWGSHPLRRRMLEWASRMMTRFITANISRYNFIPVYIKEPRTPEEEALRRSINRQALEDCVRSLEANIPVAIAPSGGLTHQDTKKSTVPITVPFLAQILKKRGKILKIVPSVVKERPHICHGIYKRYVADRILPYRLFRLLLDRLKIKRYERPRLIVEFLPPVTFPYVGSSKEDKVQFVQQLTQIMYDVLNRD